MKGKNFNFYLPDGNTTYKTSIGGAVCLILIFIWLAYALTQAIALSERYKYTIQEKVFEKELTADKFKIDKTKRFALAAGILSYGTSSNIKKITPEVGELQFYLKSWSEEVD